MTEQFSNFEEFWKHTKNLTEEKREFLFSQLPKSEQKKIKTSSSTGTQPPN